MAAAYLGLNRRRFDDLFFARLAVFGFVRLGLIRNAAIVNELLVKHRERKIHHTALEPVGLLTALHEGEQF